MTFEHVLVVGAGQMGGGIAQVVAGSGRRVSLLDPFPGAVERGLGTMRRSLERLAEKGGADPDETLGRVTPTDQLVAADLMIEAISEDAAAKEELAALSASRRNFSSAGGPSDFSSLFSAFAKRLSFRSHPSR